MKLEDYIPNNALRIFHKELGDGLSVSGPFKQKQIDHTMDFINSMYGFYETSHSGEVDVIEVNFVGSGIAVVKLEDCEQEKPAVLPEKEPTPVTATVGESNARTRKST